MCGNDAATRTPGAATGALPCNVTTARTGAAELPSAAEGNATAVVAAAVSSPAASASFCTGVRTHYLLAPSGVTLGIALPQAICRRRRKRSCADPADVARTEH